MWPLSDQAEMRELLFGRCQGPRVDAQKGGQEAHTTEKQAPCSWRFSAAADLTVALWVSDRPRQNPQPWPVILRGLPWVPWGGGLVEGIWLV